MKEILIKIINRYISSSQATDKICDIWLIFLFIQSRAKVYGQGAALTAVRYCPVNNNKIFCLAYSLPKFIKGKWPPKPVHNETD